MDIHIYNTQESWKNAVVDKIKQYLQISTGAHKKTIAISGGSTPIPIYTAIKNTPLLNDVHVFQVDERYIEHTNKYSNYKMIKETLDPKHFTYFNTELPIDTCIQEYEKQIPHQFDIIVLGLGEDGHIGSIFPNSHAITTQALVAHTTTKIFNIVDRVTMSLRAIMAAKHIIIITQGQEKKETIQKITDNKDKISIKDFPAKKLLNHTDAHIFHLE